MSTLKLSDAILLGAMSYPHVLGGYVRFNRDNEICALCSLGCAMYSVSAEFRQSPLDTYWDGLLREHWPWIFTMRVKSPVSGVVDDVYHIIGYSFGCDFRYTREQAAAWVATIEPQDEAESGVNCMGDSALHGVSVLSDAKSAVNNIASLPLVETRS